MVDIGSSSLRAGYAGDDTPKAIIPTAYGYRDLPPDADVTMSDATENPEQQAKRKAAKSFVGQLGPTLWRAGMEVGNPLVDGLSELHIFILIAAGLMVL